MGGVPTKQTNTTEQHRPTKYEVDYWVDPNLNTEIQKAPPPGHQRPTRETMMKPSKEKWTNISASCDMDTTLLNVVYDYFLHLVGRMPHASLSDNFCSRDTNLLMPMERRILAAFSQCCNIPVFTFNMIENDDINHWLRLYHTAMRCSIHPCQSGFVFILWGWKRNTGMEVWHTTCMYFNLHTNQQIHIDPPSVHYML